MKVVTRSLAAALLGLVASFSLAAELASGPMVGYSTMREVGLWVQTDEAAEVAVRFWPEGSPDEDQTGPSVRSERAAAFTAKPIAAPLEPGVRYEYVVLVNGETVPASHPQHFQSQALWQWREEPPAFTFAVGSCFYVNETRFDRPGKPYGGQYEIMQSIAEDAPDFMLWLGDNTYLREADWNSRTGIYHRYSHTRALPALQALLADTHHYATWDDHDYGPNNSDGSFANKALTREAFEDFWVNLNSDMTGQGDIASSFPWADVQFFTLDNRWFRDANSRQTGDRELLGEAQIEWLVNALSASNASFKFIALGNQFLNPAALYENHVNLAPGERRRLLDRIAAEDIPGVVFLSGDRHHSVVTKLERENGYPLYDFTVSPLTAGANHPSEEGNSNMLEDSMIGQRNYALFRVSGKREERELNVRYFDHAGEELASYTIQASELQ